MLGVSAWIIFVRENVVHDVEVRDKSPLIFYIKLEVSESQPMIIKLMLIWKKWVAVCHVAHLFFLVKIMRRTSEQWMHQKITGISHVFLKNFKPVTSVNNNNIHAKFSPWKSVRDDYVMFLMRYLHQSESSL